MRPQTLGRLCLLASCVALVHCTWLVDRRLEDGQEQDGELDSSVPGETDAASDASASDGASHDDAALGLGDGGAQVDGDASAVVSPEGLALCVGRRHACGLSTTGRLSCWGDGTEDQLMLSDALRYKSLACGDFHTCAIDMAGALHCQGRNTDGQRAPTGGSFVQVTAGDRHTCALAADGRVSCWGRNDQQQLMVPATEQFRAITAGDSFTCGIRSSDARVVCWGSNATGRATPPAQERFVTIDAGPDYACGITEAGTVVCWGAIDRQPPSALPTAQAISAGAYATCVRLESAELRCWDPLRDLSPAGEFRIVAVGNSVWCALPSQGPLLCDPAMMAPFWPPPADFPLE